MIGNILIFLSSLFLYGFISTTSNPMPGGDRGVGYAYMLFLCGAGFFVVSGLLTWNLQANGHFNWLPVKGATLSWLLVLGWLAIATSTMASAVFKIEWQPGPFPVILRWLAQSYAMLWLPLLVLIPAFWLLNFRQEGLETPYLIQVSLKIGFFISVLAAAALLFGYMRHSAQRASEMQTYQIERDDAQHQQHLADIAAHTTADPILNILSLTGRFHDADVRQAAVEKVKSHPDWEAELIRLLNETEWQSSVYTFIDGNKVDHPEAFIEPIKTSLLRTAKEIKNRITDADDLQEWHMEHFSIERCLRAIDEQFTQVPGADFRPEIRALLEALETPKPERFSKVKFTITPEVKAWLKKHS
jgi:hypothetical protein